MTSHIGAVFAIVAVDMNRLRPTRQSADVAVAGAILCAAVAAWVEESRTLRGNRFLRIFLSGFSRASRLRDCWAAREFVRAKRIEPGKEARFVCHPLTSTNRGGIEARTHKEQAHAIDEVAIDAPSAVNLYPACATTSILALLEDCALVVEVYDLPPLSGEEVELLLRIESGLEEKAARGDRAPPSASSVRVHCDV